MYIYIYIYIYICIYSLQDKIKIFLVDECFKNLKIMFLEKPFLQQSFQIDVCSIILIVYFPQEKKWIEKPVNIDFTST